MFRRISPVTLASYLIATSALVLTPVKASEPAKTRVAKLEKITVQPERVELVGPRAAQQLVVTGLYSDGSERDLTHKVSFAVAKEICHVDSRGLVTAINDGSDKLAIEYGGVTQSVSVSTKQAKLALPISFHHEVVPMLSSLGCSDIRCHGAPSGKAGFRLSLWGSDPSVDMQELSRDAMGRRTNSFAPGQSLLLQKPMMKLPHVGGQRFASGSFAESILRRWQEEGLQSDNEAAKVERLEATPIRRVLRAPAMSQQLSVRAVFGDGSSKDVTRLATYLTSDLAIATVDRSGYVEFRTQGEVAILCRYMNQLVPVRLVHIAEAKDGYRWPNPQPNNFVDVHVFRKLRMLNIPPSDLCSDREFARRVFLDLCGILPTPEETEAFIRSRRADKREKLVDALLQRVEFADFWTKKWMDVMRVSRDSIQLQGAQAFQDWLWRQFQEDRPLRDLVTDMLTSQGESFKDPATNFFCAAPMPREVTDPDYFQKDLAESTAQLFLGIRLQCAQCHNHPYEKWTQDDYLGLAAFFSQVKRSRLGKAGPAGRPERRQIAVKLDPKAQKLAKHQAVLPHFPGESPAKVAANGDRRKSLADWITGANNPYFAKSIVNRVWYHLNGRGIVEPVDDFRDSNPSANDELLIALANDFVANEFRLKHLVRTIVTSRTYQLSTKPNDFNQDDKKYFSKQAARPLPAEVLLDAICEITGVPEVYEVTKDYTIGVPQGTVKFPQGTRAVQLPVTDIVTLINTSGKYVRYELHPFLRTFGQPVRRQTCECDRSPGFSRKQALELTVGELITQKLASAKGRLPRLLASGASDEAILDDLYLRAVGRKPSQRAKERFLAHVSSSKDRRAAWEDLYWTVMNSKEFIYQH